MLDTKLGMALSCGMRGTSTKGRHTRESLLPEHTLATRSRSKAQLSAPTISSKIIILRKKTFSPGVAVCCAAETSAKSLEALEARVARFVLLAADLPDCLADFLLGGMTKINQTT